LSLGAVSFVVLLELLLPLVSAVSATNSISTSPGIISINGKVTITITTEMKCTGTISVKDPKGGEIISPIAVNIPASAGGSQSWTWPDDFPGATYIIGPYEVSAPVTMPVGKYTWNTLFMIGFFVVPFDPIGPVAIASLMFTTSGLYFKLRKRKTN
jgi:hypothetical protein